MRLVLEGWNLNAAERLMCVEALATAGSIVAAAELLGITKEALKRRIIKHRIEWPPGTWVSAAAAAAEAAAAASKTAADVALDLVNIEPKPIMVSKPEAPTDLELVRGERVDVARVSRAFSWLAALTPKRIWHEDVGDAIETICAMERAGCSRSKIRAKFAATYFWVLIAILREMVAALTGRKSPHK